MGACYPLSSILPSYPWHLQDAFFKCILMPKTPYVLSDTTHRLLSFSSRNAMLPSRLATGVTGVWSPALAPPPEEDEVSRVAAMAPGAGRAVIPEGSSNNGKQKSQGAKGSDGWQLELVGKTRPGLEEAGLPLAVTRNRGEADTPCKQVHVIYVQPTVPSNDSSGSSR
jgi:hypothetical protein